MYHYKIKYNQLAIIASFTLAIALMTITIKFTSAQDSTPGLCEFESIVYLGREQIFTAADGHELLVESHDGGVYAWDVVGTTTDVTNRPLDVYSRPKGGRTLHPSEYRTHMLPLTQTVETVGTYGPDTTVRIQIIDANKTGNIRLFNGQSIYATDVATRVVSLEYTTRETTTLHLAHSDTMAWTVCAFRNIVEVTPTATLTPMATATLTPTATATLTPTPTPTVTPTVPATATVTPNAPDDMCIRMNITASLNGPGSIDVPAFVDVGETLIATYKPVGNAQFLFWNVAGVDITTNPLVMTVSENAECTLHIEAFAGEPTNLGDRTEPTGERLYVPAVFN